MAEKDNSRECTLETVFNSRLSCLQPRQGYRFSLDAFILAHSIKPQPDDRILDLGTGCGIITLLLAYRWPTIRCTGLEIQPAQVQLARRNVALNVEAGLNFSERLTMVEGDVRRIEEAVAPETFDWVVANPPFRKTTAGRINPDSARAVSRHEITVDLPAVVRAAAFAVRNRGRVALIYPAGRAAALIHALKDKGLEPKRLRTVHDHPGSEGWLVLVEAVKNGGEGLEISPPLYVRQEPEGTYSEEMAGYFRDDRGRMAEDGES